MASSPAGGSKAQFALTVRGGLVLVDDGVEPLAVDIGVGRDGRIAAIGPGLPPGATDLNARGLLVLPGGVDSHCHIEQMTSTGLTPCDDFFSASVAALCGGTTTLVPFACQHRGERIRDVVAAYRKVATKSAADYAVHIIVSDPAAPHALEDLAHCFSEGYTSVKVYMTYDALRLRDEELLDVLALCRCHGAMVMVHAESHDLIAWITHRLLAADLRTPKYQAVARPALAEREATHRAITFAEFVGTPLLVVHVSGAEAAREIAAARARGAPIFGETCPQYLVLTRSCLDHPHDEWEGAKYLCSPPLRAEGDQQALWAALKAGELQVVSSDHSAYNFESEGRPSKMMRGRAGSFTQVPMGLPGLETRMSLLYGAGVKEGRISLRTFVDVCATNPAKLYGLYPRKGCIRVGSDADLVVWDQGMVNTISKASLHDELDYSPYEGFQLEGAPVVTVARGQVVFRRSSATSPEEVRAERGQGQWCACGKPELLGWEGRWPNAEDCVLQQAAGSTRS